MEELTATDALTILEKRAQWCRENGDSDMRNILSTARFVRAAIDSGKSRAEILAECSDDDDDE